MIHSNRQKKAEISNRQNKVEISNLAIKYVNNYVSCLCCLCCHKNNSELTKDIDTKKYEFKCL